MRAKPANEKRSLRAAPLQQWLSCVRRTVRVSLAQRNSCAHGGSSARCDRRRGMRSWQCAVLRPVVPNVAGRRGGADCQGGWLRPWPSSLARSAARPPTTWRVEGQRGLRSTLADLATQRQSGCMAWIVDLLLRDVDWHVVKVVSSFVLAQRDGRRRASRKAERRLRSTLTSLVTLRHSCCAAPIIDPLLRDVDCHESPRHSLRPSFSRRPSRRAGCAAR